ncbi:MAG: LamG domain-containing protein, partial [Bacteroidota bacterium]
AYCSASEICNNGLDDDGDGFTDCNDSDCQPAITYAIEDCQPANADLNLTVNGSDTPFSYRWSDMTAEALWQFNNSTADGSGNGHNQTSLTGTAAYSSTDKVEGSHSFSFNGSTFIRYGVDGGFLEQGYSARTYSFWIKPANLTGTKILFDQGGSTAGMACRLNGNLLSAAYRVSSTQYTTGTLTFPSDGAWHHVAVVFSSGTLTCYLDGVASTSATSASTSIAANGNNDAIGARNGTDAFASGAVNYYSGKMDDLRLFYSALSAEKVADLARNDGDRLNLSVGTYTVTVTNTSGCSATQSIPLVIVCPEICDNGFDDDADGLPDCFDDDCGAPTSDLVELDFQANLPPMLVSGTAQSAGAVYRFSSVATGVDALLTINSIHNVALIENLFQYGLSHKIRGVPANNPYIDYSVSLVNAGTSTLISPADVVLSSFDIDGIGDASKLYSDYVLMRDISGFYALSSTTTLVDTYLGSNDYQFSEQYNGSNYPDDPTGVDPDFAVGLVYSGINAFSFRMGISGTYTGDDARTTIVKGVTADLQYFNLIACNKPETCGNGSDDDGDGFVDEDDADCNGCLDIPSSGIIFSADFENTS